MSRALITHSVNRQSLLKTRPAEEMLTTTSLLKLRRQPSRRTSKVIVDRGRGEMGLLAKNSTTLLAALKFGLLVIKIEKRSCTAVCGRTQMRSLRQRRSS